MRHRAILRFYAELTDFLTTGQGSLVTRSFDAPGSVKDMIESCGVPHTEVDLIIVSGESVGFDYLVQDEDRISVYPVFESFDISPIVKVRPEPLRHLSFFADAHLGRLVRWLRLLGFDTVYEPALDDAELAELSSHQGRILLTRDVELLKRRIVTHGYFVRSQDPRHQVVEIARRFHLDHELRPFSRCMVCNEVLTEVDKAAIEHRLPAHTKRHYDEYRRCQGCQRIYWRGAHHDELSRVVEAFRTAREGDPQDSARVRVR